MALVQCDATVFDDAGDDAGTRDTRADSADSLAASGGDAIDFLRHSAGSQESVFAEVHGRAAGMSGLLADFLVGVKPIDPLTYAVVTTLLVCVTLLAGYLPARRATKMDPMLALRHE